MSSTSIYERLAKLSSGLSLLRPEPSLRQKLRANYYLFSSLEDEEAAALLQNCEGAFYQEGDIVFSQGDEGDRLYLIASGQVEIVYEDTGGQATVVSVLKEGNGFGEMTILAGERRSATARVPNSAMIFSLNADVINQQKPEIIQKLYFNMTADLVDKIKQANEQITRLKVIIRELDPGWEEEKILAPPEG